VDVADEEDDQIRVVDRRWWARGASAEPADPSALRKPSVVEDLEQRLAEVNEQLQSMRGDYRRAADEFEQAKVRIRREVARDVERGRRAVLSDLLEVLDNLDRAISAARDTAQADASGTLLRGVELVRDQFLARLESHGVARIPALGAVFDPQVHEAVSMAPAADPSQAGAVVAVVREGYVIGQDLLRPAVVVVGTHA
jgi:molecular chaperone GrpE